MVVLAPRLHGIVVIDDGNSGDALLRHFFTGFCALARDDAMHLVCWEVLYVVVCGHVHGLDLSSFSLWLTLEHYCQWPPSAGATRRSEGAWQVQWTTLGRPVFSESSVAGFATDVALCVLLRII